MGQDSRGRPLAPRGPPERPGAGAAAARLAFRLAVGRAAAVGAREPCGWRRPQRRSCGRAPGRPGCARGPRPGSGAGRAARGCPAVARRRRGAGGAGAARASASAGARAPPLGAGSQSRGLQ
ncbi:unnamed protein product [Rangifer tarandus platyrhynchus]|uniref:Uncharacterized protein n=1 Tax=Rangifer tarandus platyrhynchus TaxID=3082113 RepID=A0ABN8ZR38_RANTA|nr:unnamed protein product [Rangifer tarandus platyrhynchus]